MAPLPTLLFHYPINMPEDGNPHIFGSYKGYGQTGPGRWNAEWDRVNVNGAGLDLLVSWYPYTLKSVIRWPWQKYYKWFEKPNPGGPWAEGLDMAQMRWLTRIGNSKFGVALRTGFKQSFQNWISGLVEAHLNKKCHKNPESHSDCYQRLGKEKEDACIANPKAKDCLFVLDEYCDTLCQGCLGKTVAPTCLMCADALEKLQTAVTAELKRGIEFVQSEFAKAKGWNGTMEPVMEVVETKKEKTKGKKGKKKDKEEKRSPVRMDAPSIARVANITAPSALPHGDALTFHPVGQIMLVGWPNGTNTTAHANFTELPYTISDMRSQVQTQLSFLDPADLAKIQQASEPMSETMAILLILGLLVFLVSVIGGTYRTVKSWIQWRARRSTVSVMTTTDEDVEMEELMKEDE